MSRELLRSPGRSDVNGPSVQSGYFQQLLEDQQRKIFELIQDHKREIENKLQSKSTRFHHKNIEKQFDINQDYKSLVEKSIELLDRRDRKKAKKVLKGLLKKISEQEENLLIADRSSNGWLTVARLRNKDALSSKILKEVEKVDQELDRKKNGRFEKNMPKMDRKSGGNVNFVQTNRPQKRKAPEEALKEAVGQTRTGTCQHCEGDSHFYRECPKFWEKVIDARRQKDE